MTSSTSHLTDQALKDLLVRVVKEWDVPGIVAAVATADSLIACANSGVANLEGQTPLSGNSGFQIGSISKSFCGIVITQLEQEGRLSLDQEVREFLPWFHVPSSTAITIRHLLHHTSGLPTGTDTAPDAQAQALAFVERSIFCEPGVHFHYSNLGYAVLGLVVERITGQTVSAVLQERIIVPLKMAHSAAAVAEWNYSTLVPGYVPLSQGRPFFRGDTLMRAPWFEAESADGSIVSTAIDMSRYARMLLSRGSLDQTVILPTDSFARFLADQTPPGSVSPPGSRYARGLFVRAQEAGPVLWHSGSMVGYTSHLIADLANDVGVVVLANFSGGIRAASLLAEQIHSVALGSGIEAAATGLGRSHITEPGLPSGRFGTSTRLTITAGPSATIEYAGVDAPLLQTGYGVFAADHPSFRRAYLRAVRRGETDVWIYGPFAFPRENTATTGTEFGSISAEHAALEGAYRSYSPWYPYIDVYSRLGALHVAIGVDEVELTRVEESIYRPKFAAAAAERFAFGPIIDGHAVWVEWDGHRMSRRFDKLPSWLD